VCHMVFRAHVTSGNGERFFPPYVGRLRFRS
jgi:hypothetical protein